jgi:hypothetical protein
MREGAFKAILNSGYHNGRNPRRLARHLLSEYELYWGESRLQ